MYTFNELKRINNGISLITAILDTGRKHNLTFVKDYEKVIENELFDYNGHIIDLAVKM